jgi:hypothetical protein
MSETEDKAAIVDPQAIVFSSTYGGLAAIRLVCRDPVHQIGHLK